MQQFYDRVRRKVDSPKLIAELAHLNSIFELSGFIPEAEIMCTFIIKSKGTHFQTLLYTGKATTLISICASS